MSLRAASSIDICGTAIDASNSALFGSQVESTSSTRCRSSLITGFGGSESFIDDRRGSAFLVARAVRRGRSVRPTDRSADASGQGSRHGRACPGPRRLSAGSGIPPVVPDHVRELEPLPIHAQHDGAHHVDGVVLAQGVTAGELQCLPFGGLFHGRRLRYMPTMAASRCSADVAVFSKRLGRAGEPPKVASAGIMRELLLVVAPLREDRGSSPSGPCKAAWAGWTQS